MTSEVEQESAIFVPEKKNTSFMMAIALIVASMFLIIGFTSLTSLLGLASSMITNFLMGVTGWDTLLASIFVSVVALSIAVLFFLLARRGSDAIQRMESSVRANITNEPTEYYDLRIVPTEEILNEMKKNRKCEVSEKEGGGIIIDCEMPITRRIRSVTEPDFYTLNNIQKLSVIAIIIVIWGVYVGMIIFGAIADDLVWIISVGILIFTSFMFLITNILKLWHTIILFLSVNIYITLFIVADSLVSWSLWGAFAVYVVFLAIAYLLKDPACSIEDKWYCKVL